MDPTALMATLVTGLALGTVMTFAVMRSDVTRAWNRVRQVEAENTTLHARLALADKNDHRDANGRFAKR